jgi:hypothetical protein
MVKAEDQKVGDTTYRIKRLLASKATEVFANLMRIVIPLLSAESSTATPSRP